MLNGSFVKENVHIMYQRSVSKCLDESGKKLTERYSEKMRERQLEIGRKTEKEK